MVRGSRSRWGGRSRLGLAAGISTMLVLDAATSFVHAGLTYTRTGAIFVPQQDGTLQLCNANTPPRTHDAALGWHYRVDAAWNQLALQTHALATGWTKAGTNNPTQTGTGPNGATDAWVLTEDTAASANHNINQSIAFTSGQAYVAVAVAAPHTGDRFLKLILPSAAFGSNAIGCFDLATGATTKNATATAVGAVALGNGFWFCWVTGTATVTAGGNMQVRLSDTFTSTANTYTGNGTSGIKVFAVNVTDTAYAVPLVAATSSTVAIGAPAWSGPLSSILALPGDYTIGADFEVQSQSVTPPVRTALQVDDGTANERGRVGYNNVAGQTIAAAARGGADVYSSLGTLAAGSRARHALRVGAAIPRAALNGALTTGGSAITLPTAPTTLRIGSSVGAHHLCGGISRAWISAQGLSDAQLQSLTAF